MTAAAEPGAGANEAVLDRRLASLHLRMGQLGLARAALEALAGSGDLDEPGLLALAEARWRTGDLAGAGDAAQAYLARGGDAVLASVIAAEAVAAAGRPGEAKRLAAPALERTDIAFDRLFAGMPRSSIWPADATGEGQHAATLFGAEVVERTRRVRHIPGSIPETETAPRAPSGPGLWDADEGEPHPLPEATDALAGGRRAAAEGRLDEAAVRFALVLRQAPQLAPAVLAATDAADRRSAAIEIVRGDAFRLVGHELDAQRAYAAAAGAVDIAPGGRHSDPATPRPEENQ